MKTVYDNGGECLGDEFIDLSGLQESTKHAILQMVYLDNTLDVLNELNNNNKLRTKEIVDLCFHAFASSYRTDAADMAEDLLGEI